jgi:hypothetical protein
MNAAEHLAERAWKHPDSYGGFSPDGDYVVLTRNRDSLLVDNVNWDVACETLNAEAYDGGSEHATERPAVYHWRAGHWAVGWVEYLCVRADADEATRENAGEILCSLADYPILDENRYSNAEYEAVCEFWERCSLRDRVDYLRETGHSIFAARRDELPEDSSGQLFERLSYGL